MVFNQVVWLDSDRAIMSFYHENCLLFKLNNIMLPFNFQVSILQIASETKVYIFDLLELYDSIPAMLNECLSRILHSPRILKLGK